MQKFLSGSEFDCSFWQNGDEYAVHNIASASNNSMLQSFTKYITSVFDTPIDFTADVPISSVLYYAMADTKYMRRSGRTRNTRQFTEDLQAFYKSMGIGNIASMSQIQRALLGDRFDFSVICQIAFFLGMSVKNLTDSLLTKKQIKKAQESHYMKGKIPLDWNTYDNEITQAVGFSDYNYFLKIFKKHYGISTKVMRKNI